MIVTQEFLDAMKEYHIVGRTWFDLGDTLVCLGYDTVDGTDIGFHCEAKALYVYLPPYVVEEFINVA